MEFVDNRSKHDPRIYLNRFVNMIIFKMADRIIAVSEEVKQMILRYFRLHDYKIIVVRNGIIFDKNTVLSVDINNEFPKSEGKLKLIAVGRLYYQKGIDILINAIAKLHNDGFDNIFILIVGEGAEKVKLEKMAKDLNVCSAVKFLGIRKDVRSLMMASDIFLMPSRYEGLSIAMIESMAIGLPIIASDAPGLRYYIKNNKNGLMFPSENYVVMAECIKHLTNDKKLREKLGKGARATFERNFNLNRNIESLKKIYHLYSTLDKEVKIY